MITRTEVIRKYKEDQREKGNILGVPGYKGRKWSKGTDYDKL